MIRHRKFAVKLMITVLVVSLCVRAVNQLLIYNLFADQYYASSSTYMNFYDIEEDTVDVLFLGSSHTVAAFIPQELYEEYGITSYNLGCSSQSVALSYYLLKEALRFQKPQAVVLDVYFMFSHYDDETPLNSTEDEIRPAMNHMKWSSVKIEAILDLYMHDTSLNPLSYFLPNIRYHYRWKELGEDDFRAEERRWQDFKFGYEMFNAYNEREYQPLQGDSNDVEEMMPTMVEYLDRIAALCEQKGIELILVKTPTTDFSESQHNALQLYAEEQDIAFYDFNVESLYNELDFDFNLDAIDYGHMSYSGAVKMTNAIGTILQTEFGLLSHQDGQWEEAGSYYTDALINYQLTLIEDLDEYLTVLVNNIDRYTVFIAAQDEASSDLGETSQTLLKELGLSADWTDAYRSSYCAVIDGGNVLVEAMSDGVLSFNGTFQDGIHTYSISSGGFNTGESCSIMLNIDGAEDIEYAQQQRGLNIVVFDNESHLLIDSICFDTYDRTNGVCRTPYYSRL